MFVKKALVGLSPPVIGAVYCYYINNVLMIGITPIAAIIAFILLHCCILSLTALLRPDNARPGSRLPFFLFGLGLFLTVPFAFMQTSFGTRDVGSLLITINENQIQNMAAVGIDGFIPELLLNVVIGAFLLAGSWSLTRYFVMGRVTVYGFALLLILFGPLSHYGFRNLVPSNAQAMINTDLVSSGPTILARPKAQRNLVIIYLESLERTYRDLSETAEAFAPFAEFEDRGLSFRNLDQAEGTGFTAGGLVATQCGVPLVPRGVFNVKKKIHQNIDVLPDETDFMAEVPCLGDVLAEDGYTLSYINGSVLSIFSKGEFFRSHSYKHVKGLKSWPGWETEPRQNIWGMDDDLLFERLTAELRKLAAAEAPFVLATLTIATHGPDGFLDQTCPAQVVADSLIPSAIACTGDHVTRLLDEIEHLGIADETLVVLLSDHLSFRNTLNGPILSASKARRNYAVVLGGNKGINTRSGTMLDIYPTLLELLGYSVKDGRAGLGQSLLGDAPTFLEREGLATLDAAIRYNTALQQTLWKFEAR